MCANGIFVQSNCLNFVKGSGSCLQVWFDTTFTVNSQLDPTLWILKGFVYRQFSFVVMIYLTWLVSFTTCVSYKADTFIDANVLATACVIHE